MTLAERFAHAAIQLIGTPFRLNGRNRRDGLDCVGLVACALEDVGIVCRPPVGYRLRQHAIKPMLGALPEVFAERADSTFATGDLVLARVGPLQHHLGIIAPGRTFVHAHAGLRKVVRQSGAIPWPIVTTWRLASARQEQVWQLSF